MPNGIFFVLCFQFNPSVLPSVTLYISSRLKRGLNRRTRQHEAASFTLATALLMRNCQSLLAGIFVHSCLIPKYEWHLSYMKIYVRRFFSLIKVHGIILTIIRRLFSNLSELIGSKALYRVYIVYRAFKDATF